MNINFSDKDLQMAKDIQKEFGRCSNAVLIRKLKISAMHAEILRLYLEGKLLNEIST